MANADVRLAAYIERLANDPEFIRQCEESDRKWNDLMSRMAEGDEVALAEFRADTISVDELRAKFLGES